MQIADDGGGGRSSVRTHLLFRNMPLMTTADSVLGAAAAAQRIPPIDMDRN